MFRLSRFPKTWKASINEDFHPQGMGETVIARFSHFVYHTGMLRQISIFILIVGVFFIILFFTAETKNSLALEFFCLGAALTAAGFFLWNRSRDRGPASRFRSMKKIFTRKKEEK